MIVLHYVLCTLCRLVAAHLFTNNGRRKCLFRGEYTIGTISGRMAKHFDCVTY